MHSKFAVDGISLAIFEGSRWNNCDKPSSSKTENAKKRQSQGRNRFYDVADSQEIEQHLLICIIWKVPISEEAVEPLLGQIGPSRRGFVQGLNYSLRILKYLPCKSCQNLQEDVKVAFS